MSADSDDLRTDVPQLLAALEREQGKLRALQDIGEALGSTLDQGELLARLLGRI